MIIVTGATGQLGKAIVEELLQRLPADQIGVSVRDADKARALSDRGVRVRRGDFEDGASLRHSFEGASQILMISSNAGGYGGDPIAQHRTAIEAALAVSPARIVYTSHMAASPNSAFAPMRTHHATEEMLRQSGLSWTALRHGFYAASALLFMGDITQTRLIQAPADGKVSWTTHADLAKAVAIIMAEEKQYQGPTPPLTASKSLDLTDLAAIASDVLHHPIQREILEDAQWQTNLVAQGVPNARINMMLGFYRASRLGEFAAIHPLLQQLLGHPPQPMSEVLAAKFPLPPSGA